LKKHALILALFVVLIAGCTDKSGTSSTTPTGDEHAQHVQAAAADTNGTYTLDAKVHKEGDSYVLEVQTNLKLSEDHYNQTAIEGEGHIHYYLNETLIGPIKSLEPLTLTGLQSGTNVIRLVLATNNHGESYNAEKTITFDND
jgi:hypothetical protein